LVSCIRSLRNAIENENEKTTEFSALFVEKRNGVPAAVFSVPKQSIGKWLTNSRSAALKIPN